MMALIDFIDRFGFKPKTAKQESLAPSVGTQSPQENHPHLVATPELIELSNHTLRFYPGFEEYSEDWNAYARTEERLARQTQVLQADYAHTTYAPAVRLIELEEELPRLRINKEEQQRIYDSRWSEPNKNKLPPLKNVRRELRRKTQEWERVSGEDSKARSSIDADRNASYLELRSHDDEFALSDGESRAVFYIADRLRDNQTQVDSFMAKYIPKVQAPDERMRYIELKGVNFKVLGLLRRYDPSIPTDSDDLFQLAGKAARRQFLIAGTTLPNEYR